MSSVATARLAAAGAALVLAGTSRGDVVVLGLALGLATWRPMAAVAATSALAASAWRWGSTSLDDVAGAQAVLGPAGWVDPPLAAVGSWLGAAALVLVAPAVPRWVGWAACGAAAAVVVAGPAPGDDLWIRAVATLVALGAVALLVAVAGGRRWVEWLALAAGLGALLATAPDAPPLGDALSGAAALEGAAVAAAAAAAVASATQLWHHRAAPPTGAPNPGAAVDPRGGSPTEAS